MMKRRLRLFGAAIFGGLLAVGCTPTSAQDGAVRAGVARNPADSEISGEIGALRIQPGDCLRGLEAGLVTSAEAVPCDSSHQYEVYHRYVFPDGDYPGDTTVSAVADEQCLGAFAPFVGLDYADSVYGYTALQPVQESWDRADDREVLCLIGRYDGSAKTGTARGTSI
ncbi:MAG: septum formation family protein [Actinomycetota bacterium]